MRFIDELTVEFKKDLSNVELYGIERMIDEFDRGHDKELPPNDHMEYGLAYTSSSKYAMYGVTEDISYCNLKVDHFAITENNMLIMICMDDVETTYYYEVETSDLY